VAPSAGAIDLGGGIWLEFIAVDALREQDKNARAMQPAMFNQLVANVKKRGQLESLPYCAVMDRRVEIVSGHHRVRAARAAGLKTLPVLIDRSGLTRSAVAAKQLAHNTIAGFDDPDILREIARTITDVDDLVESFLPEGVLPGPPNPELEKLLAPRVGFEWKMAAIVFLPHQLDAFEAIIQRLGSHPAYVGVAPLECFEPFAAAVARFSKAANIASIGTALAAMAEIVEAHLDREAAAAEQAT
jgi:hypothetical protein